MERAKQVDADTKERRVRDVQGLKVTTRAKGEFYSSLAELSRSDILSDMLAQRPIHVWPGGTPWVRHKLNNDGRPQLLPDRMQELGVVRKDTATVQYAAPQ